MRNFVRKALEKLEKLEMDQIKKLLLNISKENEALEMVLHSMTDGVIVLDNRDRIVVINKAAKRLIPFTSNIAAEIAEKIIWEVTADKEVASFFYSTLKSHEKASDVQFTLVNGGTRIISVSIMPLVNVGKIHGNLIHIEDITERKSREARLRRAESLAALTTLTAGVAHEIKNPLGSIGIHIQLIKKLLGNEKIKKQKDIDKYLNIIAEEVDRLNKVVVDFLFAVHPMNTEFHEGDLNTIINDLIDFLQYELEEAGIKLKIVLGKIPQIELDEKYIKQALLNIIKNAIGAMPQGGELTIETLMKENAVHLKISDTGIGIPDTLINKIFEPYFTTKEFGSGIGLTIVYKIIKEHLGDILVSSRENEGTTFTLIFPVSPKEKHLLDYSVY